VFYEYVFCIFEFHNGYIDGLKKFCSLLILLCNGQNKAEYKAYWLMGFQKLILEARASHSFHVECATKMMFQKSKKQEQGKICDFTGSRDHMNKK